MAVKIPNRTMEFSQPTVHAGWRGGAPVYVVFSIGMAKLLFEEFERPVAICVAPPLAAVADTYEQAVNFFSDDNVAAIVDACVFDASVAPRGGS